MKNSLDGTFAVCGAMVYDGLGNPPADADVVIRDGMIAAVEKSGELNLTGVAKIKGEGLALAPGFIDTHSHSDLSIMRDPKAYSRITQGVTFEVIGNCGDSSSIMLNDECRRRCGWDGVNWTDLASYEKELNRRQPAVNIASLCGHSTLRATVVGYENRKATTEEIRRMREILATALKQGAAGFSSGLIYIPGMYSDTAEVVEIARALKGTGKAYFTHMRSESDYLIEAVKEAVEIAAAGDNRLQISHLKTMGQRNWFKINELIQTIENARAKGMRVTADRYPYIYCGTNIQAFLPAPYNSTDQIWKLMENPAEQEKLRPILERDFAYELKTSILCDSPDHGHANILGLTFEQIGKIWDVAPAEAFIRLLKQPYHYHVVYKYMCEENLKRIFSHDWVMPGSDGYSLPADYSIMRGHPRSFGTFPTYFRMVREFLSTQEAIRRMTSLPASVLNLNDRGVLKPGMAADLVLFDEEKYDSKADYFTPHTPAEGVDKVFVAGKIAFDREELFADGRHGKFIRV